MQTNKNRMAEENEENIAQQMFSKYLPYWPMFLLAILLAAGAAYAYIRYATPIYEATATLIIKDEKKGNEESKLMESLDQISSKKIVENEIEVIQSRKLMSDVVNKLGLYAPISQQGEIKTTSAYLTSPVAIRAASPDSLTNFIKIKLNIDKNNQEVILNDTFNYPLNQIVTTPYGRLQFLPNKNDALAKNTLAFVEDRLSLVSHDLDSIEKKVQQYKSGRGAVDISTQGQLYLQNVSANDQKLSEVNTQLSVLDQVEKFVKNKDNSSGIVPSTLGVSDPMLSQLMDKLYTSELEYEKLKKTVGENNPNLVSIKDQINKIKPNILQNIQSQQQSLTAAKQNINATNGGYNSILQAVPQKERQLLDISREQQIKSNIYSFLLQKKEESEIAYASTVSNNRVIDYAQASPSPVSPNSMKVYLMAIVAFLGLCFAIITVRELLT